MLDVLAGAARGRACLALAAHQLMEPKPIVTLKEIARRAGVTPATVSVALSGKSGTTMVRPELRDRIRQLARQMGYQRNILARGLQQQKSYLIGFILREGYAVYALETTRGIQDVLSDMDYSLLLFQSGNSAGEQLQFLNRSQDRKVDGLIIGAAAEAPSGPMASSIAALLKRGFPLVQLYRQVLARVPVVMTDDRAVGVMATRHLIQQGHRRIVHYTYDKYQDTELPANHRDALYRCEGYVAAMREAGLQPVVITYPYVPYAGEGYSLEARACAAQVIRHPSRPTAATTFCDYTALGLMKGLADLGVPVPEEFSVVGYDNIEAAAAVDPALTTLRPLSRQIGQEAVRRVLDLIDGKPAADKLFQPELIVRASSAPPRIRAGASAKKGRI